MKARYLHLRCSCSELTESRLIGLLALVVWGVGGGLLPRRCLGEAGIQAGFESSQIFAAPEGVEQLTGTIVEAARESLLDADQVIVVCIGARECAPVERELAKERGAKLLVIRAPDPRPLAERAGASADRVSAGKPPPADKQVRRWKRWLEIIKWARAGSSGTASGLATGFATGSPWQGGVAFLISAPWAYWQQRDLRKINAWLMTHGLAKKFLLSVVNSTLLQLGELGGYALEYGFTGSPQALWAMAETVAFRSALANPISETVRGAAVSALTQTSLATVNGILTENAIARDKSREALYLLRSGAGAYALSLAMVSFNALNRRPGPLGYLGLGGAVLTGAGGAIAQYYVDPRFRNSIDSAAGFVGRSLCYGLSRLGTVTETLPFLDIKR